MWGDGCNNMLLRATFCSCFKTPRHPRPPPQQQHYPHTYHHHHPSQLIPFISTETTTKTDRRARCGYAHYTSYVAIVKAPKFVPQERISERMCEHVVDVSVPQVAEHLFVVPKPVRILQRTVEEISRCSRAAYDRTVCRSAEGHVKTESSSGLSNRSLTPQFRR